MLIKVIKKQTIFLLKQKEASLTFILLLAVVLGNYITNVLTFRGTDISQMYQPMKLLALSLNKVYFSANIDRKSTRLNSSHLKLSRMPSSA